MNDMQKVLKEAIGDLVDGDTLEIVKEAIEKRIAAEKDQLREQIEEEVRAEFSKRVEADMDTLVRALDKTVSQQISEEIAEFQKDRKVTKEAEKRARLAEQNANKASQAKFDAYIKQFHGIVSEAVKKEVREFAIDRKAVADKSVKLSKQIFEAKQAYKSKLDAEIKKLHEVVQAQVRDEIAEFQQDRKLFNEKRQEFDRKAKQLKEQYNAELQARTKKLEEFVLTKVREEIDEFQQDKQAYENARIRLIKENAARRKKLEEQFVTSASKMAQKTLSKAMKQEILEFRDDIMQAKNNTLGQKMFETFYQNWVGSPYAEGTEVKKLMDENKQLREMHTQSRAALTEQKKRLEETSKAVLIERDRSTRAETMRKLLSPLGRNDANLMESLLEDVPTDLLESYFKKYLPKVVSEKNPTTRGSGRGRKESLSESQVAQRKPVILSGNRKTITEGQEAESEKIEEDQELGRILQLAS